MTSDLSEKIPAVKVVLLGESGVGKSSVALRFTRNEFLPYTNATIGTSFMSKRISLLPSSVSDFPNTPDNDVISLYMPVVNQSLKKKLPFGSSITSSSTNKVVEIKIWDTAGQEKYHSLAPIYYRGADAAILVYDVCDMASFITLQSWVNELRNELPHEITITVCGNKSDMNANRTVDMNSAKLYAEGIGGSYIETSARDNDNIQQLFLDTARRTDIIQNVWTQQQNVIDSKIHLSSHHEEHNSCVYFSC